MKKLLLGFLFFVAWSRTEAQIENPVEWTFSATKISAGVYDVVLTAQIEKPWHLYSQLTGKGGPIPTTISFRPNPLLQIPPGKAKEIGKPERMLDPNFGQPPVPVVYFSNEVRFVKRVTVKGKVSTNIGGTVEYMVCNDSKCLPPTKKTFDIKLN
jgi:DsbC/DsbD-like thiol-disulfide interchange protein